MEQIIGHARYDGGKVHRAELISNQRDDFKAILGSTLAAGIFIGLVIAAIFGGGQ